MLGRGVNTEIGLRPPGYFWGDTLRVLRSGDAVVANLECAITAHTEIWTGTPKVFYFRADPEAVDVLKAGNVKCVTLANNHSLDFEEEGLLDMLKYLDKAGICRAGAGRDITEAAAPALTTIGSLKVALIGLTDNEPSFAANGKPGTNFSEINTGSATMNLLKNSVESARQHGAELIILSIHWGPNMVISPPHIFRKFARAAADLGVNIVHGHSAHIFQGIEARNGNLIMYDTGDFIDDYAIDPILRNDWSFIFLVDLDGGRVMRLRLVPVLLSYCQVNLARGAERQAIIDRMKELCEEFDTRLSEDEVELVVDTEMAGTIKVPF